VSEPSHAVFLSYASQDAEAAQRICEALRTAGIEVWFDQSELRGGDAWDRQIRKEIHDCALFIPVISAHAQARLEGYFRREWKLAADRTHDMAEERAFLVPVGIEVWFDQSELRGGDAWDRQIRKEILSSSTIPRNDTQAFRRNSTRCSGRTCRQGRRRPLLPIADGISSP
jgi:hypothetical protein